MKRYPLRPREEGPDDLEEVILFLIDQASKSAKKYSQRLMDAADMQLTIEQWVLLKIIEQFGPIAQVDLAGQAGKDPASITRMLDALMKRGLVIRTPSPVDRRSSDVQLSDEGHSYVETHMDLVRDIRRQSLQGLSEAEIRDFKRYLSVVRNNMSR